MARGTHRITIGSVTLGALCGCNTHAQADADCAAQLASALATLGRTPSSNVISASDSKDPAATVFDRLNLHGYALADGGPRAPVELTLQRREGKWLGHVRQGDAHYSTLENVAFQLLDKTPTLATYRMGYAIDTCEHAQPKPAREAIPWQVDLCAHDTPATKPRVLRHAEVRLSVQTQVVLPIAEGPSYVVSALGAPDIASLDTAHVLRGVAIVAKETP